jgi:hypothetical protein
VHGTALVCVSRRPSRLRARCAVKHSFSTPARIGINEPLRSCGTLTRTLGVKKSPLLFGPVSTNTHWVERTCTTLHVFYFDFPRHATNPGHCRFCADCIKCVGVDGGPAPGARKRKPLIQCCQCADGGRVCRAKVGAYIVTVTRPSHTARSHVQNIPTPWHLMSN